MLTPAGIRVNDQRLRPRVGADLVCDDGFFRELKTFSGPAWGVIRLTRYEQARALNSRQKYELVIVENLLGDPVITIIPDPLGTLCWQPTGDVEVIDWQAKATSFRVIRLGAPTTDR